MTISTGLGPTFVVGSQIGFADFVASSQLGRRSMPLNLADLQGVGAVGDLQGHARVLFDEEDGRPLAQFPVPSEKSTAQSYDARTGEGSSNTSCR
jgi:hypothetical protein